MKLLNGRFARDLGIDLGTINTLAKKIICLLKKDFNIIHISE
ncbi:MAG: hypothetical protein ACOC4G_11615 [Bacillota bacterium]